MSIQTITPGMAASLGLSRDYGVIVSDVWPGGPALAGGWPWATSWFPWMASPPRTCRP
jgi:S1-C subfamily serine protease